MALTEQGPGDGTLQLIPIAKSMAFILTRALMDDVGETDLCGSKPARALSVYPTYHSMLLRGLVSIPKMNAGDTVWWHPDVVHAVGFSLRKWLLKCSICGFYTVLRKKFSIR